MHRPRREHEQQFRDGRQRLVARHEHDLADSLGQGRASGLARHRMRDAALVQAFGQKRQLRRFAHSLDSLNGQKSPRNRAHFPPAPAAF